MVEFALLNPPHRTLAPALNVGGFRCAQSTLRTTGGDQRIDRCSDFLRIPQTPAPLLLALRSFSAAPSRTPSASRDAVFTQAPRRRCAPWPGCWPRRRCRAVPGLAGGLLRDRRRDRGRRRLHDRHQTPADVRRSPLARAAKKIAGAVVAPARARPGWPREEGSCFATGLCRRSAISRATDCRRQSSRRCPGADRSTRPAGHRSGKCRRRNCSP